MQILIMMAKAAAGLAAEGFLHEISAAAIWIMGTITLAALGLAGWLVRRWISGLETKVERWKNQLGEEVEAWEKQQAARCLKREADCEKDVTERRKNYGDKISKIDVLEAQFGAQQNELCRMQEWKLSIERDLTRGAARFDSIEDELHKAVETMGNISVQLAAAVAEMRARRRGDAYPHD